MKSTLSATHLLKAFLLFVVMALLLLTMARLGYSLWQIDNFESIDPLPIMFITGLRFDLAYIGMVLLIPVTLGTFLSLIPPLHVLARYLILLFLFFGLLLIIFTELVTPFFINNLGVRPSLAAFQAIENPIEVISTLWIREIIPLVIGFVVGSLVLFAFMHRLGISRFLLFPVSALSGLPLLVVGAGLCILAIVSNIDFIQQQGGSPMPLHPSAALISTDQSVNEIALNSPYKLGWSLLPVRHPE